MLTKFKKPKGIQYQYYWCIGGVGGRLQHIRQHLTLPILDEDRYLFKYLNNLKTLEDWMTSQLKYLWVFFGCGVEMKNTAQGY